MTEQDEGRRGRRAAVVLFDQLVSLKLPYPVGVVLHFLECEAKEMKKERKCRNTGWRSGSSGSSSSDKKMMRTHLKMAMSRLSSSMLAKSK